MWGVSSHYAATFQPWTTRTSSIKVRRHRRHCPREGIRALTGRQNRLSAKIAGGANMFANTSANGLDIGAKNITRVHAALEQHRIRLIGEDVGGSHGRRINFNLTTGEIVIRLHNGEIRKL